MKTSTFAGSERETALEEFYKQWKDDSLVMLKWIGLQVSLPDAAAYTLVLYAQHDVERCESATYCPILWAVPHSLLH